MSKFAKSRRICFLSLGVLSIIASKGVHAQLKALEDSEMSRVSGQGVVAFDVVEVAGGASFTKVTMGLNTDIQVNADRAVFGEYELMEGATGSDVNISNISLGHISTDASKVELDGKTYAVNEIVPFEGIDPYFEISQDSGGDLVGFRVGFSQARGSLSGDISSFTGNIGLKLDDGSGEVKDAQLLTNAGLANSRRATHIGLESETTDCFSLSNCAPLSNLKTLDVGMDTGTGSVDFTQDLFFSYQKQATDWQIKGGAETITANPGVFMNIPTSMTLDMTQLTNGLSRARTEYIDRGVGVF